MTPDIPKETQRIAYLDILRILATFGVVFLHVSCREYYSAFISFDWYLAAFNGSLVRWSVPVFVMISGALFLNPAKDIPTKDILSRKIPRLLLAYVFWWLVYSVIMSSCSLLFGDAIGLPFSYEFLMPRFHLWFLPMLMGIYLLIPVLRKIAADEKLLRFALVLWIVYLTGSFFMVIEIPQITPLFDMNIIVGHTGYFLLGYYLSKVSISTKQLKIIYLLGIIGFILTVAGNIILSIHDGDSNDMFLNTLSIFVVLMAAALFVFIKEITPEIESKTAKFVAYVRQDLFGIYLTHALWLTVLNRAVIRNLCNQAITIPLIAIAVFVLSLYTTKLIRKIPFLKKFVE